MKKTAVVLVVTVSAWFGAIATADAADLGVGRQLYGVHCASCHGASGVNVVPGAPNFTRNEGLQQPDASLLASIRNGKNKMRGFAGVLKDAEIVDVIAYVRTLKK